VRPHKKAAFTLLELIVVIFIVSAVVAVVIPAISGLGEDAIKKDARKIVSILMLLNDTATATKETQRFNVDFRDKTVTYKTEDAEKKEKIESLAAIKTASGGLLSAGDVTVFFGALGANEAFKIFLSDGKTNLSVTLNPMSGRIKIDSEP
jgi:prepilin-type N-terminal cleavage/methylation domain-containing protein